LTSIPLSEDRRPAFELPSRGTEIDRWWITAEVHRTKQVAIFQARERDGSNVALKLAMTPVGEELIDRESRFLQLLEASAGPAPRFAGAGSFEGRRYCATGWKHGGEARTVAWEVRDRARAPELISLCSRIVRAHASLHAAGVVHGHVHPRHVLVDLDGSVGLVDFTLAAAAGDAPPSAWALARFNSLSAPEQAESVLQAHEMPLTAPAEQYSLAALLFLLITGRMYAPLRLERRGLAHDILHSSPARFEDLGLPAWPTLEAALGRALRKDPRQRYPSLDELAQTLEELPTGSAPPPARARTGVQPVQAPLARILESFRREAFSDTAIDALVAPTCSINFGAAGVAYALTRLGKVTGDPTAFERAEFWLSTAERRRDEPDAFDDGDQLTPQSVGLISPYHTRSGLAATRALLSEATGNRVRQRAALDEFQAATQTDCASLDLTLGRSSVLLFAAILYAGADPEWPSTGRLGRYGDRLCSGILNDLSTTPIPYYGIAHGWAGIAYAALMWAQARGVEPPRAAREVVDMLVAIGEPYERGTRWPVSAEGTSRDQFWAGWCHGSAGYVFLWNLARATYHEDAFGELAERAAWSVRHRAQVSSLCCGAAGQAYALLNHYRSTGDDVWCSRAVELANQAATQEVLARDATTPLSLYKGHVGLALLAAELEYPEHAAMPLFEREPRAAGPRGQD
jgi:eukaryotic-like serine/threonine-protein kinase